MRDLSCVTTRRGPNLAEGRRWCHGTIAFLERNSAAVLGLARQGDGTRRGTRVLAWIFNPLTLFLGLHAPIFPSIACPLAILRP